MPDMGKRAAKSAPTAPKAKAAKALNSSAAEQPEKAPASVVGPAGAKEPEFALSWDNVEAVMARFALRREEAESALTELLGPNPEAGVCLPAQINIAVCLH